MEGGESFSFFFELPQIEESDHIYEEGEVGKYDRREKKKRGRKERKEGRWEKEKKKGEGKRRGGRRGR